MDDIQTFSELEQARQNWDKTGTTSKPAKPAGRIFSPEIKNDNTLELDADGKISDRQNFREYNYLLRYLLNGYGLPLQLQNFAISIYTFTKAGETYHLSDKTLSKLLGLSCENYICKLRKTLRLWFAQKGAKLEFKNPRFIAIKENRYNKESRDQESTGYTFNIHFSQLIDDLISKSRNNQFYERDWMLAIEETCEANKSDILKFGETWERRPQRKNRTWEQIQETLFLQFTNQVRKIFDHHEVKNIAPEKVLEQMQDLVHLIYEQKYLLKNARERNSEQLKHEVIERLRQTKLSVIKHSVAEKKINVLRCSTQSSSNIETGRNADQSINVDRVLEPRETLSTDDRQQSKVSVDSQRKLFLERLKKPS